MRAVPSPTEDDGLNLSQAWIDPDVYPRSMPGIEPDLEELIQDALSLYLETVRVTGPVN